MIDPDIWLLDRVFQRISDWFQKLVGKDNFFLARCFLGIWVISLYIPILLTLGSVFAKIFLLLVIGAFAAFLLSLIQKSEQNTRRNSKTESTTCFNPSRQSLKIYRLFGLIFWLYDFLEFIAEIAHGIGSMAKVQFLLCGISYLSLLYFASCTPKPPGENLLKKFLGHLRDLLSPEPVATPA